MQLRSIRFSLHMRWIGKKRRKSTDHTASSSQKESCTFSRTWIPRFLLCFVFFFLICQMPHSSQANDQTNEQYWLERRLQVNQIQHTTKKYIFVSCSNKVKVKVNAKYSSIHCVFQSFRIWLFVTWFCLFSKLNASTKKNWLEEKNCDIAKTGGFLNTFLWFHGTWTRKMMVSNSTFSLRPSRSVSFFVIRVGMSLCRVIAYVRRFLSTQMMVGFILSFDFPSAHTNIQSNQHTRYQQPAALFLH